MQGTRGGASQAEGAKSLKPRGAHMLWQPRGTEKEGDDSRMRVERELFSLRFFQWRSYGRGGGGEGRRSTRGGPDPAGSRDPAWLRPWLRACEPRPRVWAGCSRAGDGGVPRRLRLGEGNVSRGGRRSEEGTVCAVGVLKRESEHRQKSGGDTALVLDAHLQFGVMV